MGRHEEARQTTLAAVELYQLHSKARDDLAARSHTLRYREEALAAAIEESKPLYLYAKAHPEAFSLGFAYPPDDLATSRRCELR